jgi:hypothetical protein
LRVSPHAPSEGLHLKSTTATTLVVTTRSLTLVSCL